MVATFQDLANFSDPVGVLKFAGSVIGHFDHDDGVAHPLFDGTDNMNVARCAHPDDHSPGRGPAALSSVNDPVFGSKRTAPAVNKKRWRTGVNISVIYLLDLLLVGMPNRKADNQ